MSTQKISQSDLPQNGHSKKFEFGETAVLIANVDGDYFAIAPECTHWHGPLDEGMICGHTVMCPWHHACFDLKNGKPLEPPALDALETYNVTMEGGDLIVDLTPKETNSPKVTAEEDISMVIVGGGAAGQAAAEELRHQGFDGQIIILSAAAAVPVDRPNLSKDYLAGNADPDWIPLRSAEWYEDNAVEIRLNTTVTKIETAQNRLQLSNGETLNYHKLLLATGGKPRELKIPGHDLNGIFLLREWKDADAIMEATASARKAVIIGSSFIGMEVAAALGGGHELEVTVVSPDVVPFERTLGKDIGQMFQTEHENHNVVFRLENQVTEFVGHDGKLTAVILKNGEKIPADLAVVGIGVQPNTAFLDDSGLELGKDGSVLTSQYLQSSHPDIFAAGDIARWEDGDGENQRIEHWRVALQQGKTAARNMLDQQESILERVPFFWTTQWDISLSYVGHATAWDEIIYLHGNPADKTFVGYFLKDGKLQAAASVNRDEDLLALEFALQQGKSPSAAQLLDENFDIVAFAKQN
jgi:NADPH-dependent 2,4-dienoyl-CoA reductase/sulfur reductase-like enzyme/nitrite reductase/ring-hydroxylating ferredoxin subunit